MDSPQVFTTSEVSLSSSQRAKTPGANQIEGGMTIYLHSLLASASDLATRYGVGIRGISGNAKPRLTAGHTEAFLLQNLCINTGHRIKERAG